MTKQEWLDCKDLNQMLVKSQRKRQLFSLACCRSIEHLMLDQRSKDCLEKIELFIDGKIDEKEFELARQAAWDACTHILWTWDNRYAAWAANSAATNATWTAAYYAANAANDKAERFKQIEILKDIYNPFLLDLRFSDLAISLAEQVYEGDASARFVLSDYLEEEGYSHEIVMHLKSGFHYKGCWLIDQILGKS